MKEKKSNKNSDFDGHTNFKNLTAEQKLLWLSQAASFVSSFKGKANKLKLPKNKKAK